MFLYSWKHGEDEALLDWKSIFPLQRISHADSLNQLQNKKKNVSFKTCLNWQVKVKDTCICWTQKKAFTFQKSGFSYKFIVLCTGVVEVTFTQLLCSRRKEFTIFLLVSFHLFYRCHTLKQKSPSLHLNFVSHNFISDCGHLGSWTLVSTLIKWKTITQGSQLSGMFPYRDLKTAGFFSVWFSPLSLWSTTEINLFSVLCPSHNIWKYVSLL